MMAIGYPNLAGSSTITASSAGGATPASNMATSELSSVWRSTDATAANTVIDVDHGAALTARVVALVGHNLSTAATVRWVRGTSAGASDVADSGTLNAWAITPTDTGGHHVMVCLPASSAARYERLTLTDEANADGYLEVAWLSVWAPLVQTYGAEIGLQDELVVLDGVERSATGALWGNRQRPLRQVSMVLRGSPTAEADALHELLRCAGRTEPVLYVRDLSDRAATQRYGFVATLAELSAIEFPYPRHRHVPLRFTEYA